MSATESTGTTLEVRPLTPETWLAFDAMVQRHNGIFGGCWCIWFHPDGPERGQGAEANRALKKGYVESGAAHAALVMDGDEAVAWAEFGTPCELPTIHHRKQYDAEKDGDPDYRITCVFVDKRYRRRGITEMAIRGALDLIAQAGGGLVESYPHDLTNQTKKMSSSFLYNGTRRALRTPGLHLRAAEGAEELRDVDRGARAAAAVRDRLTKQYERQGVPPMSEEIPLDVVLVHVDRALTGMAETLRELGDERANTATGLPGGNTAYQIVRHCCGVMEFWGGRVLADRAITRDRPAEFTSSGSVDDLILLLERQRDAFTQDLAGFDGSAPPRGPLRERDLDRDEVRTQGGVLLHIYEELAQHRGHLDLTADIVRAR